MAAGALLAQLSAADAAQVPPKAAIAGDGTVEMRWLRVFGGPADDWFNDLIALGPGGFLAVGFVDRAPTAGADWRGLAVRIDGDGELRWERRPDGGAGIDALWAAGERSDGSLVMAGFGAGPGDGALRPWLVEMTKDGEDVRERRLDGAGRATDLALAPDGSVALAGQTDAGRSGREDFLVIRIAAGGRPMWTRTHGDDGTDRGFYIERAPDGGYVVAGISGERGDSDILVIKLDAGGELVWRRRIGEPGLDDLNHGLAMLHDGRVVVTGYARSWGARDYDVVAIVLSPTGEILRHEICGGPGDDRAMSVRVERSGRAWIAGYTRPPESSGWAGFVTAFAPESGFLPVWSLFDGPGNVQATAALPLDDGDLLVAGYSDGTGLGGQDAFLLRSSPPREQAGRACLRRRIR